MQLESSIKSKRLVITTAKVYMVVYACNSEIIYVMSGPDTYPSPDSDPQHENAGQFEGDVSARPHAEAVPHVAGQTALGGELGGDDDRTFRLVARGEHEFGPLMQRLEEIYAHVRDDLLMSPQLGMMTDREKLALSGGELLDTASLAIGVGLMDVKARRAVEREAAESAESESEQQTGTPSTANVPQLVSHYEAHPEGFEARVIEAKEGSEDTAYSVAWFRKTFERYQKEGTGSPKQRNSLWGSLRRQYPEETGFGRIAKILGKKHDQQRIHVGGGTWVVELDVLRERYGQHLESEGVVTAFNTHLNRGEAYGMVWDHRIKPLDAEYRQKHPEALCSPFLLERAMRLAAADYRPGDNAQPLRDREDMVLGTIATELMASGEFIPGHLTDISKTADGLELDALDRVIEILRKNQEKVASHAAEGPDGNAYTVGNRPAEDHELVTKLEALRVALQTELEIQYNGPERGIDVFVREVFDAERAALIRRQAATGRTTINFFKGDLDEMSDDQVRSAARALGTASRFLSKTPAGTLIEKVKRERMVQLMKLIRARGGTATQASDESGFAGLSRDETMVLQPGTTQQLLHRYIEERVTDDGRHGLQTDEASPLNDESSRILRHIAGQTGPNKARYERERARLLGELARQEEERVNPADKSVYIAVGDGGSARAMALGALLSEVGGDAVTRVLFETTPDEHIPPHVISFLNERAREQAQAQGAGQPVVFEVGKTPRTTPHGTFVALGDNLPLGLDPKYVLQQTAKNGITWIPFKIGTTMADKVMRIGTLLDAPHNRARFAYEAMYNPDMRVHPNAYGKPYDSAVLAITTRTPGNPDHVPNEIYRRLTAWLEQYQA